ncbi:MAG: hypothetical protein K8R90_05170 [Candidatus Cloacimonetes bacterium]|nr:hypothetical protein [Candidatus Cloacimonadota bacterium]
MTYTKLYRVAYDATTKKVITVLRGNSGVTMTNHACAEFDTETELDAFIARKGLTLPEETHDITDR